MTKAPMAGSRKAKVYDAFHDGGLNAALKEGKALALKEGTVKSWCGGWAGKPRGEHQMTKSGRTPSASPAQSNKPKAGTPDAFEPWFKHVSREAADGHLKAIAKRSGCDVKAFHIIEEQGRFAVVPAHRKAGPPPQFEAGDVVFDTIIPNRRGKVVKAGPEQTEVRYKDHGDLIIPNNYLYKFEKPEPEGKTKRVRV